MKNASGKFFPLSIRLLSLKAYVYRDASLAIGTLMVRLQLTYRDKDLCLIKELYERWFSLLIKC